MMRIASIDDDDDDDDDNDTLAVHNAILLPTSIDKISVFTPSIPPLHSVRCGSTSVRLMTGTRDCRLLAVCPLAGRVVSIARGGGTAVSDAALFAIVVGVAEGLAWGDDIPDGLFLGRAKQWIEIISMMLDRGRSSRPSEGRMLLTSSLSSGKPPFTFRSHTQLTPPSSPPPYTQTLNLPPVSSLVIGMSVTLFTFPPAPAPAPDAPS